MELASCSEHSDFQASISTSGADITEFERCARKWGEDFVRVYQRCNITPYIHAFMNHVGDNSWIHSTIQPTSIREEK